MTAYRKREAGSLRCGNVLLRVLSRFRVPTHPVPLLPWPCVRLSPGSSPIAAATAAEEARLQRHAAAQVCSGHGVCARRAGVALGGTFGGVLSVVRLPDCVPCSAMWGQAERQRVSGGGCLGGTCLMVEGVCVGVGV